MAEAFSTLFIISPLYMKDFASYRFEDFITDTSFINYAKGREPNDINMWEDWLSENPEHRENAEEARNFINHIFPKGKSLPQRFIDDEWNRLHKRLLLDTRKVAFTRRFRLGFKIWPYAATIALIISLLGVKYSSSIFKKNEPVAIFEIHVPKGEIKNVLLPDGTLVYLNSSTTLSYASDLGRKDREVTLEGEAFFEVSHSSGKVFIVHTGENNIEVLGTAFNVRAYPEENLHQTSLERGKIKISGHDQKSLVLDPNQTYLLIRDVKSYKVYKTEKVEDFSSWKDGRIVLRNSRLSEITRDLERTYDVVIQIQKTEILNKRYTGEFSRTDDIMKVLKIISLTSHFDIESSRDTIYIR